MIKDEYTVIDSKTQEEIVVTKEELFTELKRIVKIKKVDALKNKDDIDKFNFPKFKKSVRDNIKGYSSYTDNVLIKGLENILTLDKD